MSINSSASIYYMLAEIQDTEYLCYYLSFPTQYVKLDIIFLTNNIWFICQWLTIYQRDINREIF